MTSDDWAVLASFVGFAGSLTLIYPGWRASRNLKRIESIRRLAQRGDADGKTGSGAPEARPTRQSREPMPDVNATEDVDGATVGADLVPKLESDSGRWNALDHGLLIAGIVLICVSFALDLFLVRLA